MSHHFGLIYPDFCKPKEVETMHTETTSPAQAAPASTAPSNTLKVLRAALRDMRRANRPGAGEDYVARATDRVDAAFRLPVENIAEADAMMRLVLESDGDGFDPIVRRVLTRVSTVLAAAAAS